MVGLVIVFGLFLICSLVYIYLQEGHYNKLRDTNNNFRSLYTNALIDRDIYKNEYNNQAEITRQVIEQRTELEKQLADRKNEIENLTIRLSNFSASAKSNDKWKADSLDYSARLTKERDDLLAKNKSLQLIVDSHKLHQEQSAAIKTQRDMYGRVLVALRDIIYKEFSQLNM